MTALQELYATWAAGNASTAQQQELMRLLALPEHKELAMQLIARAVESEGTADTPGLRLGQERLDLLLQSILVAETQQAEAPVVPLRRFRWLKYAAAIVLLAGAATWAWNRFSGPSAEELAREFAAIPPGRDRAVLTLSDGSTILLDSAATGALAQEGHVLISKTTTGAIVYDAKAGAADEVMMNTMSTPRGGQYQLTLPDGTKAWLNAASSIRYPTVFKGDKRVVEITGEAYFEVAKDKTRPFYVSIHKQAAIEVTGTSFNVNAYSDEASINTTLVEGAVRVHSGDGLSGSTGDQVILKPGQQARLNQPAGTSSGHSAGIAVENADIEKVIAWKKGLFNFEGSTVREAMKQLSRWYDIEIRFDKQAIAKGLPNDLLAGGIRRDLSLGNVVELLTALGLHFRMEEGRRLVLLP